MTGWEKVAAATLVAVVGLLGLNLAIWRRLRATLAHSAVQVEDGHERDFQAEEIFIAQAPDHIA